MRTATEITLLEESKKPGALTLPLAVDILNSQKHRGYEEWTEHRERGETYVKSGPGDYEDNYYSEFDAIAIAEKYLREGGPYVLPPPYPLWPPGIVADILKTQEASP